MCWDILGVQTSIQVYHFTFNQGFQIIVFKQPAQCPKIETSTVYKLLSKNQPRVTKSREWKDEFLSFIFEPN